MNAVLVGVGVLPHKTPMTPRDLLAVHLLWKGSHDCQMLRLAHMRMQSRQADRSLVCWWHVGMLVIIINTFEAHSRLPGDCWNDVIYTRCALSKFSVCSGRQSSFTLAHYNNRKHVSRIPLCQNQIDPFWYNTRLWRTDKQTDTQTRGNRLIPCFTF